MATWDETPEERIARELKEAVKDVKPDPDALKKIQEKIKRGKHEKPRGKHRKK